MVTGGVSSSHVAAFAGPSAEAGADIRDTLAVYFLTPEGQSTGN